MKMRLTTKIKRRPQDDQLTLLGIPEAEEGFAMMKLRPANPKKKPKPKTAKQLATEALADATKSAQDSIDRLTEEKRLVARDLPF